MLGLQKDVQLRYHLSEDISRVIWAREVEWLCFNPATTTLSGVGEKSTDPPIGHSINGSQLISDRTKTLNLYVITVDQSDTS